MPNQATNTVSGNWRARLQSEFYDLRGRQWRIELIDNKLDGSSGFGVSQSTVIETKTTGDGFKLTWDGPTDTCGAAIIPSTCQVTWIIDSSDLENLKSQIRLADDSRFGLALYYDNGGSEWEPYWVGILNHEAIEYETQDQPYMVTLTANCGLNRLGITEYKHPTDGTYLDEVSLAETIARCINKIPTANFWLDTDNQLSEVVDLFEERHHDYSTQTYQTWASSAGDPYPISMIERTVCSSATFSTGGEQKEDQYGRRIKMPPNYTSCLDVLENIASAFSARITLARFSFWFFPPNALNWSHSLNVQRWTRALVAAENIDTVQDGSDDNKDTSTVSLTNFRFDIDSTHALGGGWSNSYLLPVKRCVLTFKNAGLRTVFGSPKNFYLEKGSTGPDHCFAYANNGINVTQGDVLRIKGTYSAELQKEYDSAVNGAPEHGEDRIGAKIILRFKIMINTEVDPSTGNPAGTVYYYGSEYSGGSSSATINMPTGWNSEGVNVTRTYHNVDLEDAEWTTTEKFFDVIVPWTNSDPAANATSSGDYIVGGLHIQSDALNTFKYDIGTWLSPDSTQQDNVTHTFDFSTVPLPDAESTFTGITVEVERLVLTRNNTVKRTFPELENIFKAVYVNQSYNWDGSNNSNNDSSIPKDRFDDFLVIVGEESEDADWDYYVEQDDNSEFLDIGETTIGSNYTSDGAGSDGALKIITHDWSTATPNLHSSDKWNTINDEIDNACTPQELQYANLRENLYKRGKPVDTQRGLIVPQVSTATNYNRPADILSVFHHNCSSPADLEDYIFPFNLSHIGSSANYELDGFVVGRESVSFEFDEIKVPKGPSGNGGVGGNGGGVAPSGTDSTIPNGGNAGGGKGDVIAENVAQVKSFLSDSQTNPPAAGQTKLLVLDENGQLSQLSDGSAGQVLTSNGSGVYSFVTPTTLSQTATPTGAVDDDTPNQGATVTWTATNYDGVTTYIPVLSLTSNGSTVLSGTDFTQNGAVVTFTAPSNTNAHTLSITAVSAGKSESVAWTDSITPVANISSYSYYRFLIVDSSGNVPQSARPAKIDEIQIFSQSNYSGTDNPTTAATGGNQNNSGLSDFSITHGFEATSSQSDGRSWNAFDNSNSTGWSSLGIAKASGADNWLQIQFTASAKPAGSIKVTVDETACHSSQYIKVMASNTGSFSGEETTLTTFGPLSSNTDNTVHSWTT